MIATAGRSRTEAQQRARTAIDAALKLGPDERLKRLKLELDAALAERQLLLLEAVNLTSPDETDLSREDDEAWDEVGIGGQSGGRWLASNPALRTLEDLRRARDVARELACENEYALGAHERLQDYVVGGTGLVWSAVPRDMQNEDKKLTTKVTDTIKRIREQESWGDMENELVLRGDRDGEGFFRTFPNALGPMRIRYVEPEHVRPPLERDVAPFGVEVLGGDPVAYWVLPEKGNESARLDRWHRGLDVREGSPGIPAVLHYKQNVDANVRRGWPTFYPIRRNLARAEKLLRNMSYVATLQAAIALIKRYETATSDQVAAMIQAGRDGVATNATTGRESSYVEARPGQVWHAPRGVGYEAPISSVNASNNVEVLQADLRACAVRSGFPEFLFTGKSSGVAYSSELVKESPFVKKIEGRQGRVYQPLRELMLASLIHEEFMDRLPRGTVERYELMAEFPNPVVRDVLQDRQGKQILRAMGALSVKTMRAAEGLDDTTEERNLEQERASGYADARSGALSPGKPAPGSTSGGPGGPDQKREDPGQPGRPPGSSSEPTPGAPPAAGVPAAPGAETVQDTALNGAQVQALQGVVQAVADKQLPATAAVELLTVAFPQLGRERAATMVNAAAAFVPKPDPQPAPAPAPAPAKPPAEEAVQESRAPEPALPTFSMHFHPAAAPQVFVEQAAPTPPVQVPAINLTAQVVVPPEALKVDVHLPPPAVPTPKVIEKRGKFIRDGTGKILGFEAEEKPAE